MDPTDFGGAGTAGFPQTFEVARSLLDAHHPEELLAFLRRHTGSAEAADSLLRELERMELGPEVDFVRASPVPSSLEHSGRTPERWEVTPVHAAR